MLKRQRQHDTPPFGLTPEQGELYRRLVPKQVDRAAAHVIREYRAKEQEDDFKQEGTIAIGTGIPEFDPVAYDTKPETWGLFRAMFAMLDVLRAERRYKQQIMAMRVAMMLHTAFGTGTFQADRDGVEEAREKLTEYQRRICMGMHNRLAATPIVTGSEEDPVVRASQRRIVEVMERLVSELSPEQRELLQRAYAYDHTNVKKAAEELGGKGYRAVLRAYHELIALLGARFAGEGFNADNLPPWPDEASGTILGLPAESASGYQR